MSKQITSYILSLELMDVLQQITATATQLNLTGQVKYVYPNENVSVTVWDDAIDMLHESATARGMGYLNHNFEVKAGYNVMLLLD